MLILLGYVFALCTGLILGLIGGGGAVLTIPILIYIFHVPVILASAYALCIAAITAGLGFWRYRHQVQYKQGVYFVIPSLIGVYTVRRYVLSILPDPLCSYADWTLPLDKGLLLLLGFWMLLAAYTLLKSPKIHLTPAAHPHPLYLGGVGLGVGFLSGLIGIGGGILIVPALTGLVRMDIKKAIPTSLMIITIQSSAGVLGDLQHSRLFDLSLLLLFSGCSLTGMLIGTHLSPRMSGPKLKKIFGLCLIGVVGLMATLESLK